MRHRHLNPVTPPRLQQVAGRRFAVPRSARRRPFSLLLRFTDVRS
jgi:hypothetical protein